jgi:hypothetical protein
MKRTGTVAALTALLGGVGVCWAAPLTLTSAHLGAAAATTPVMFPVSVTVANKAGGTVGRVQNGDVLTLVWSQAVDESSLCSTWTNLVNAQSITLQWSVIAGTAPANDRLAVTGTSATCVGGFHVGSIDLGSTGYDTNTANIDFPTTTNALSISASTTTLTATLNGQKNGTAGTVSSGSAAVWTPDAALKDRSGRSCGTTLARSSATVQF